VLGFVTTAAIEEVSWRNAPSSYFEVLYANGLCLPPQPSDNQGVVESWGSWFSVKSRQTPLWDVTDAADFDYLRHVPGCGNAPPLCRVELLAEAKSRPKVSVHRATHRLGLCSLNCEVLRAADDGKAQLSAVTTGWPMRCVSRESREGGPPLSEAGSVSLWHVCVLEEQGLPSFTTRNSIVYFPKTAFWRSSASRLWILPLGLVADTALFGAAWLGVMLAIRGVVRWRRVRRSQCVACGYLINDLSRCPECGESCTGVSPADAGNAEPVP
jgi:hypothetical protein